jgi:nondiscriminating aspartyl-tRNA synthetase
MERIWTSQLEAHAGEIVRLNGWLHRLRRVGGVGFLVLRDAKGTAQVVVEDPAELDRLSRLPHESVLTVEGRIVAEPQAPGAFEIHEPRLTILVEATAPPPFDLFRPALKAQLPTILDHAPVALRHPRLRATWRLAAASMEGFRATLRGLDFVEIQTPKIVAGATESGANVFPIDYFGRPAFLAQSPQLYKQIMVGVFERVFEVGPVFRAEPHDTQRHLNQYVSLDAEMGFIENHRTVMDILTRVIQGMVAHVEREAADAVVLLSLSLPVVPEQIPIIHFADAQALLERETGEKIRGEPDLAPAHERWLGEWARQTHGSDFLFVEGYPMVKRPFYTHPESGRPEYSNSFDLLFRGIELVTGGQRLHHYADYLAALQSRGVDPEPLRCYVEAFKHGMPPHGGFAIGLERWVSRLTGATNVRETALFPRDINRLTP